MMGLLEVVFTGVLLALQPGTTTLGHDITISMQRDAMDLFFHKPWACLLRLIVRFLSDKVGNSNEALGQNNAILKSISYNIYSYNRCSVCVSSIPGDLYIQCEICSV